MEVCCDACKEPLPVELRKGGRKYCSRRCAKEWERRRYRSENPPRAVKLASGTTGAMHELLVAYDLMSRGFHVFRALSPSCVCDLAVIKDEKLLRVEVRTAYRRKGNSTLYCPVKHRADILALVEHNRNIEYRPALERP